MIRKPLNLIGSMPIKIKYGYTPCRRLLSGIPLFEWKVQKLNISGNWFKLGVFMNKRGAVQFRNCSNDCISNRCIWDIEAIQVFAPALFLLWVFDATLWRSFWMPESDPAESASPEWYPRHRSIPVSWKCLFDDLSVSWPEWPSALVPSQ